MCGIAGVLSPNQDPGLEDTVQSMLVQLERRGPDDQGIESRSGVILGNRRLSILDRSAAGHQPMISPSRRFTITFNGEIYNYRDLCKDLSLDPGSLQSGTDTEVLLHAWERWGVDTLPRLVGQFAFAMWDEQERVLWLVRDRFGEKPLFWHRDGVGRVAFASSLGALLQADWIPRELDPDSLSEFVTLRYVVAPRTLLREVQSLPGGSLLRVAGNSAEVRSWWKPRFRSPRRQSPDEVKAELGEKLVQACKRCLVADVPVALLLSDGIDSHAVRAGLGQAGIEVPSFTYRMTDSPEGLESIPSSGTRARTVDLVVSPEDRVKDMVPAFSSLTQPVGDGASLATWLLIRGARDHATVFLCGHGGDEVMGGYRLSQDRFRLSALRSLWWLPLAWTGSLYDRYLYGLGTASEKRDRLRRVMSQHAPREARYLIHRPLPHAEVAGLTGRTPRPWLGTVEGLYEESLDATADLDAMQEVMLRTFLSENILSFADSVAMDSSAELRMPFLDRDLVEFVLSLPPSARVGRWPGRSNTKRALKWWAKDHVHSEVVRRKKHTFNFGGVSRLMESHRKTLQGYVLDSSAVRRGLPGVESWLDKPSSAYRGPWEGTLWGLLALGIWCEAHGVT